MDEEARGCPREQFLLDLSQLGMCNSDVTTEIECNRSTVFRAKKRFVAAGLLESANGKA